MGIINSSVDELALFGGEPAFERDVFVGRPNIGDRDRLLALLTDMLDRRWLTNDGPLVQEFERRLCEFLNVKHCVLTCNATVALEILVRALGLKGEVIVPSYTFIATAHALQWQGVTPVFADVDPATHSLNPDSVNRCISSRTSAILGVHLWGQPCNVDALQEIANRYNLHLLFDAAHAFACSYGGRMIGTYGEAEVFSFHATKFFNSFEGGAIATNSDAIAKTARLMRNFGFAGLDRVVEVGTNGKMTEVCAAMGITSLESIPQFVATNKANYESYRIETEDLPGIRVLKYPNGEARNYQYIVVEVDASRTGISRDRIVEALRAERVFARRYFMPGCHRSEPYKSMPEYQGLELRETERLSESVMVLPNGSTVSPEDVKVICGVLKSVLRHAPAINAKLMDGHSALTAGA